MSFFSKTNRSSIVVGMVLMLCPLAAYLISPKLITVEESKPLDELVPTKFADWEEVKSSLAQVSLFTNSDTKIDSPYDQVLMRTYKNSKGDQVMLSLAWGQKQRQEIKIHRPELCYVAQGFKVKSINPKDFAIQSTHEQAVTGKEMLASNGSYDEAVSYWIRIGDTYSDSAWDTRIYIFKEGLAGKVPDGILVRASSIVKDSAAINSNYSLNKQFLTDLVGSSVPELKMLIVR